MNLWGMYWRYLLSISLTLVVVALMSEWLGLLSVINNTLLLPTIFWGFIAAIYISITFVQNKGFAYVFLGRNLGQSKSAWCKLNFIVISLFIILALFGYFVGQMANSELWSFYKLYIQTVCIVFFPLFGAWFVTGR